MAMAIHLPIVLPCINLILYSCPSFARAAFFHQSLMNKVFRFIVGVVFLITGLLKAIDTSAFADLMSQYGMEWFGFGAPALILAETFLGLCLIFNLRPRLISFITSVFIIAVSAIYLYGIAARGITNCGCFGPLGWLNSKSWLTFTRNGILLALLVPSMIKPQQGTLLSVPMSICMSVAGVVIMFMCGFTFRGAQCLIRQETFHPVAMSESELSKYVTCNQDSTYLVFAFSYNCPYCQNSVGNVNQYQPMGYVDRVIGIALEDSVARCRFERMFDTNFEIKEIPQLSMLQLTNTLPTTYLIRRDTIVNQYSGMVVSPALLMP